MKALTLDGGDETNEEPGLTDEALLAACRSGDRAALAELVARHGAAVRRLCVRMNGGASVDDLVQLTFLAAWTQGRPVRGAVRAWLLGVAAHQCHRHHRSERRLRAAVERWMQGPRDPPVDVEQILLGDERHRRLLDAIDALPPHLRVVFHMVEVEDVKGAEAARALGIREGTLWRRLHDARRILSRTLGGRP